MDGNTATNLEFLKRIIALLLSLASRAEAASSRSWRVRGRVLVILRRAEIAAFSAVARSASDLGAAVPPGAIIAAGAWMSDQEGNSPQDAMALAQRFRALAFALAYLVTISERSAYGAGDSHCRVSSFGRSALQPFSDQVLAISDEQAIRAPP